MKNIFTLTICLSIFILFQAETNAQWTQSGPVGGKVYNLAAKGNTIYAATYGGVLSSQNGIDWTHSNWGMFEGDIESVVATDTKVYAGTWGDGLYYRDLNGLIWQHANIPANPSVQCLAAIGNNVFAGTYSAGVFLTTDNGTTWTQVNNGLTASQVQCFVVKGTDLYAGVEGGGVFRTTNNGANWINANNGLPSDSPISLGVNGDNIYVGLWANGIYYSPDNGEGWLPFGEPVGYPSAFAFNGNDMYVCGSVDGIYLTTNNGTDWTKLENGIPDYTQISQMSFIGNNLVVGEATVNEYSKGMFVSTNYGADWSQINWELPKYCVDGIVENDGNLFAATCGGMYRSTNEGSDWVIRNVGDNDWADLSAIGFRTNLSGFAGDENGYSYSTTNSGDSWYSTSQVEEGAVVTGFAFIGTKTFASTTPFMAGVAGGVYLSSDAGDTWNRVSTGLPALADTNTVVSSLAVIGTNLFAGTGHGVYLSTDNGTSWTRVSYELTANYVYALAVKDNELFAGCLGQGVFRTNDNGAHWTHTSLVKDVTALAVIDTNLFAGTWAQGLYRMANFDSSWTNVGLPGVYVTGMAENNGKIYISTEFNSVWTNEISALTDVKSSWTQLPGNFKLSQNYPNPFNPSTTIQYTLNSLQKVTLKVYDILGKEIITLVNEEKPTGTYEVKFNAKNLSSGIYFYRIQAGNFSEARKMILLR